MPKKKKTVKKPAASASRTVKRTSVKSRSPQKHRTVSFLIGVITLAALAFLFFHYTKDHNYKQVLGDKIQIQEQGIYTE